MITNEDKDYIDTCEYVRIQFFAMKLDVYFVFEMFPFSRAVDALEKYIMGIEMHRA